MKQKIYMVTAALLVITLAFSFGACGKKKESAKNTKSDSKSVALLLPFLEEDTDSRNDLTRELAESFKTQGKEAGLEVSLWYHDGLRADEDPTEKIDGEFGAVVIIPGIDEDMDKYIDVGKSSDTPTVILHNASAGKEDPDFYIGLDYKKAVKRLIDEATESAKPSADGAHISVFAGPSDDGDDSISTLAADIATSDKYSSICDTVYPESYSAKDAYTELISELKNIEGAKTPTPPETLIGAIVTTNASMARGAIKALAEKKLTDKIPVFAISPSGLKTLTVGASALKAVMIPDIEQEAKIAATTVADIIAGKEPKKVVLVPLELTNSDSSGLREEADLS